MALVFPIIGKARGTGERTKAANNLRQICLAYNLYSHESGLPRALKAKTPYDWVLAVARAQGLNEAALFYIESDPLLEAHYPLPTIILDNLSLGAQASLSSQFQKTPISYSLVAQLPPGLSASTTPIAWTRGLQTDGSWAANSPYGGRGGHIGFLDGHVVWYNRLVDDNGQGLLSSYNTGTPTANIKNTLPPSALILE
jgi:prepilin-type processing-associated H-X9-DG protein